MIKIDGMDLREIDLMHLRTHIGVVPQENFLFSGTIRENIAMAKPDASFADVVRAAQLAGAEEFIERLPRGYDTLLEEGATNLSGGQRQRLALARALLIDPPVLILDEATSALDAESEAIVNANLKRMAKGRRCCRSPTDCPCWWNAMRSWCSSAARSTTSVRTRNCCSAAISISTCGTSRTVIWIRAPRKCRWSSPAGLPDELTRSPRQPSASRCVGEPTSSASWSAPSSRRPPRCFCAPRRSTNTSFCMCSPRCWCSRFGLMAVVKLDRVVTSVGRIVPSAGELYVSPFDTGIVRQVDVKAGEVVKKGQPLATLDPTFTHADLLQLQQKLASDTAAVDREQAELSGRPYECSLDRSISDPCRAASGRSAGSSTVPILANFDAQVSSAESQVAQSASDSEQYEKRLKLAGETEKVYQPLLDKGYVSKLQLMQATDDADGNGPSFGGRAEPNGAIPRNSGFPQGAARVLYPEMEF